MTCTIENQTIVRANQLIQWEPRLFFHARDVVIKQPKYLLDSRNSKTDSVPLVDKDRQKNEMMELEQLAYEFDDLLDHHLDEEDKLKLSYYLHEFEINSCDLSELLTNLLGDILNKLPNPFVKYKALNYIKSLYILPNIGPRIKGPGPRQASLNDNANADSISDDHEFVLEGLDKSQSLDLRLLNTIIRRYLVASRVQNSVESVESRQSNSYELTDKQRALRVDNALKDTLDSSVRPIGSRHHFAGSEAFAKLQDQPNLDYRLGRDLNGGGSEQLMRNLRDQHPSAFKSRGSVIEKYRLSDKNVSYRSLSQQRQEILSRDLRNNDDIEKLRHHQQIQMHLANSLASSQRDIHEKQYFQPQDIDDQPIATPNQIQCSKSIRSPPATSSTSSSSSLGLLMESANQVEASRSSNLEFQTSLPISVIRGIRRPTKEARSCIRGPEIYWSASHPQVASGWLSSVSPSLLRPSDHSEPEEANFGESYVNTNQTVDTSLSGLGKLEVEPISHRRRSQVIVSPIPFGTDLQVASDQSEHSFDFKETQFNDSTTTDVMLDSCKRPSMQNSVLILKDPYDSHRIQMLQSRLQDCNLENNFESEANDEMISYANNQRHSNLLATDEVAIALSKSSTDNLDSGFSADSENQLGTYKAPIEAPVLALPSDDRFLSENFCYSNSSGSLAYRQDLGRFGGQKWRGFEGLNPRCLSLPQYTKNQIGDIEQSYSGYKPPLEPMRDSMAFWRPHRSLIFPDLTCSCCSSSQSMPTNYIPNNEGSQHMSSHQQTIGLIDRQNHEFTCGERTKAEQVFNQNQANRSMGASYHRLASALATTSLPSSPIVRFHGHQDSSQGREQHATRQSQEELHLQPSQFNYTRQHKSHRRAHRSSTCIVSSMPHRCSSFAEINSNPVYSRSRRDATRAFRSTTNLAPKLIGQQDNYEDNNSQSGEESDSGLSVVPSQAKGRMTMDVAEQMRRQARDFVQLHGSGRNSTKRSSDSHRLAPPTIRVRRTLRVKIKKSKPILGIAIEGGFNVSGQLLPRIVCVHEDGAAYQCAKLRASDLILEVNGTPTANMTHEEIAKTIATAYYQDPRPFVEFVVGESMHV